MMVITTIAHFKLKNHAQAVIRFFMVVLSFTFLSDSYRWVSKLIAEYLQFNFTIVKNRNFGHEKQQKTKNDQLLTCFFITVVTKNISKV